MYSIIRFISSFIRENMLPNPFEVLGEKFNVDLFGLVLPMTPDLFMLLLETFVLGTITFAVVGLYYERGSTPAWGSFLYLTFYCIHIGLLQLMGKFAFNEIACGIIIALYIILHGFAIYFKYTGSLMFIGRHRVKRRMKRGEQNA